MVSQLANMPGENRQSRYFNISIQLKSATVVALVLLTQSHSLMEAQDFASWKNDTLVLRNSAIERVIVLGEEIYTEQFFLPNYPLNYVRVDHPVPVLDNKYKILSNTSQNTIAQGPNSEEFSFMLNDKYFNNRSSWRLHEIVKAGDSEGGSGATIVMHGSEDEIENVKLSITYLLYPGLPVIRKKLALENVGAVELKLEVVDIERFSIPWSMTHNIVYADYYKQSKNLLLQFPLV